jgi:8-oxo-dGTP pyrophosphatase MutT (NUDIX family)
MIIFIKDRPIRILDEIAAKTQLLNLAPDKVIDARLEMLKVASLKGNVLIMNTSSITTEKLFHFLNNFDLPDLQSVYLVVKDKELVEKRIKKMYSVIKAAGGIVTKDEKMLLIHRRGVWDLPKGKLDNGEKSKKAAVREVEEETGVRADLVEKVCTTWHTYTQGGELVLKRTKWYWMRSLDDSRMLPQLEEQIDRLEWMTEAEVRSALVNSFSSIRYVVSCFLRQEMDVE